MSRELYIKSLEEFMVKVAKKMKVLPDFIDPENGNDHLFRAIAKLQNTIRNSDKEIEDLKKISPDHVSYLEEMSRLQQQIQQMKLIKNCGTCKSWNWHKLQCNDYTQVGIIDVCAHYVRIGNE